MVHIPLQSLKVRAAALGGWKLKMNLDASSTLDAIDAFERRLELKTLQVRARG